MNSTDFLLERPVSDHVIQVLRFAAISLHLYFVLVTLGTAILAMAYFVTTWWLGKLQELRWDKEILRTFLAHKSLAVVLGVGPLLLVQVGYPVPFFSAVHLLAPSWLVLIVLLIAAFLCMDFLGHRIEVHRYWHLVLGVLGLASLLAVPGIFVAVLVTAENPERWAEIADGGYQLTRDLAVHWLMRYLHVLGAAVVFAGLFHYFWSRPDDVDKRASLLRWVVAAIVLQFVLGFVLYLSMPRKPDEPFNVAIVSGGVGGVWLLAVIVRGLLRRKAISLTAVSFPAIVLLLGMLMARQFNQDRAFVPLTREADAAAVVTRKKLEPYRAAALDNYKMEIRSRSDGKTLFAQSCAFCHGDRADGRAPEAIHLAIAPENLAELRTTREHLHKILLEGVPGTAMPRFGYFTRPTLDQLIDYLEEEYKVLQPPGPVPVVVPDEARIEAKRIFDTTCTVCHSPNGPSTKRASAYRPPPPDLSVYSMTPRRTFAVITDGYPGTMMPAFKQLPENVRWGLVEIVQGMAKHK